MKHVAYLGGSILGAVGVSLILASFGAHGLLGFLAVYAGYPGGFVDWKANLGHMSYFLISTVNAAVYFIILEALGLLIRRRRRSNAATRE
jgi:hypothetical protein